MLERGGETVKVIVRCRPMNGRERNLKCREVVEMDSGKFVCALTNPAESCTPPKTFTFDSVYGQQSTTEQIYNDMVYSLVEGVIEGYNATIFAYGQTGCGKSFTMQGPSTPAAAVGIIPRSFDHVFEATSVVDDTKFLIVASYIEIYNEDVRDLLGADAKRKLDLKENPSSGVYVQDLSRHTVQSVEECQRLMDLGWANRSTGATLMNADSSRSHSIFTITVEAMTGEGGIRRGKLNLVDLAGSERQSKTGAAGERLREATKINLSLMALGNVISALVDGKAKHIPYRDSKLTRLLQDSLGGNTKTLMIACLSPADNNYDETLSTLRYANRAKNITNKPRINEDPKDAMLRQYQQEIENLRKMLANGGAPGTVIENLNAMRRDSETDKLRNDYDNEMIRLKEGYEREQMTKKKLQEEMEALRRSYEVRLSEHNNKENTGNNGDLNVSSGFTNASQQAVLDRLKKLQEKIVGGERAGDLELQEKRNKKRKAAEKRLEALARALATVNDDDGAVLRVYDDIQVELRAKTENLRKYKQRIRTMEKDIVDIQSEFERDRTDFLDTIRRNERQLLLHQQIIDKMASGLKRECNYSNYEKIKENAEWSEDQEKWILPDLVVARTKLPPAGHAGQINWSPLIERLQKQAQEDSGIGNWNNLSERISSGSSDSSVGSKPQRLERSEVEDLAGNYFKPRRANELLNQAREDATRAISTWKDYVNKNKNARSQLHGSLNALNLGSVSSAPEKRQETLSGGSLNNSWSGWGQKPSRLQALPKPKINKMDLI